MRIAIATAVYYPMTNGVAVFSHNLATGLAKRGHEVLVLCPSQTGKNYSRLEDGVEVVRLKSIDVKMYPDQINEVPPKKRFLGIDWPHLYYKNGFKVSVFPVREVKRALDKFRPDVVHVQVSDPVGLSVASYARKRGVPVVTTEHNQPEVLTGSLRMPEAMRRPINGALSAYFRNRQTKSDFVTMPTEQAVRKLLGKRDLGVPIAAVSNGVDLSNFCPGKVSSEIYKKYNLNPRAPIVLHVGRIDPEKQVGTILEVFKKVQDKIPRAELVIVGDGVDLPKLKKLTEDLEITQSVKFLGRVLPPDLYEIYKVGDVFVTASEIETQGIVLIEAAASGLPLVAVAAGAVTEVCQDGVNGFLCEPHDIDEMANTLVEILQDEKIRSEFSQNSLKIAAEHDLERTLDKFVNIYERVQHKK